MKNKYNLLVKRKKGQEYLIHDMIATKLNEKQFNELKKLNTKLLGEHDFINYKDTDFSWWSKVDKQLTARKLIKNVYFEIDFYGNVTKYN